MATSVDQRVGAMAKILGPKVLDAYALAAEMHEGQRRKTGEPYITHPVAVAEMLTKIGADEDVICAALLHDVLEDQVTAKNLEADIYSQFGDHVLYLVRAVSKDMEIEDKDMQFRVYLEHMRDALETDIFVFFIKVADLLHNLQTIVSLSEERKRQWIHELKYEYVPLFSEHFHHIAMAHQKMYLQMVDLIEKTIEKYDNGRY